MTFDQLVSIFVIVILLIAFCTGAIISLIFKLRDQERDADQSRRDAIYCEQDAPAEPVVLVRTRAPLKPDERARIAAAWFAENGPTLHLVEDALDQFMADAVAGVCREDITPTQREFSAAALDASRRFRAYLFSLAEPDEDGRRFRKP